MSKELPTQAADEYELPEPLARNDELPSTTTVPAQARTPSELPTQAADEYELPEQLARNDALPSTTTVPAQARPSEAVVTQPAKPTYISVKRVHQTSARSDSEVCYVILAIFVCLLFGPLGLIVLLLIRGALK